MTYHTPSLSTIRNAAHCETRWHLSVTPKSKALIWSGKVNGTDTFGAESVSLNEGYMQNGAVFANILAGQSVFANTTHGWYRVRLKSISGNASACTITVAENAVPWDDNIDVQIYRDYPIFPVFPYMTDPGDGTTVFYKDKNVAYSDQNTTPIPVAVAGPDRAKWLTGATVTFQLDGSDSYAIATGASISSYAWVAEPSTGATFSNSAIVNPVLTISVANDYWIKLTVTDSNGKTNYTRFKVYVHNTTTNPPIEIGPWDYSGGWSRSGFIARFALIDDADQDNFYDEARILIWTEDFLDDTEIYEGGWTGAQMNKFQGYVISDTTTRKPGVSGVQFEAESASLILDRINMYSVSLQYDCCPNAWWKYADNGITVRQAIHHLWQYHSTLFQVCPVLLCATSLRSKAIDDFERGSLLQQARTFAYEHGIFANVCCNEQGVLYVEKDGQIFQHDILNGFNLTDADWAGDMEIAHQSVPSTSFVQLSGFSFDGAKATPIISKAPGVVAADRGQGTSEYERLILESQSVSNALAGRVFARENNAFPQCSMKFNAALSQSLAVMVVPQAWNTIVIEATDTVRGFDWSDGKNLVAREISAEYDKGRCIKTVTWEPYAEGAEGITGDYPTEPPDEPDEPDEPPEPPLPPPPNTEHKVAVAFDNNNGCYVTLDNGATWTARNTGLTSTALLGGGIKRGWQSLQGSSDPEKCILYTFGLGFIYVSMDFGKTWVVRTPVTNPPNSWSDTPAPTAATVTYRSMDNNNSVDNVLVAVAEFQNAALEWRGWVLRSTDLGVSWTWQALSAGSTAVWNNIAHAATASGVFRTDDGTTWSNHSTGIAGAGPVGDATWIQAVCFDPWGIVKDGALNRSWACGRYGIWHSIDREESWHLHTIPQADLPAVNSDGTQPEFQDINWIDIHGDPNHQNWLYVLGKWLDGGGSGDYHGVIAVTENCDDVTPTWTAWSVATQYIDELGRMRPAKIGVDPLNAEAHCPPDPYVPGHAWWMHYSLSTNGFGKILGENIYDGGPWGYQTTGTDFVYDFGSTVYGDGTPRTLHVISSYTKPVWSYPEIRYSANGTDWYRAAWWYDSAVSHSHAEYTADLTWKTFQYIALGGAAFLPDPHGESGQLTIEDIYIDGISEGGSATPIAMDVDSEHGGLIYVTAEHTDALQGYYLHTYLYNGPDDAELSSMTWCPYVNAGAPHTPHENASYAYVYGDQEDISAPGLESHYQNVATNIAMSAHTPTLKWFGIADSDANTWVATGNEGGNALLYVSVDAGATWAERTLGMALVQTGWHCAALLPALVNDVLVIGSGKALKSANLGVGWTDISTGFPNVDVYGVEMDWSSGALASVRPLSISVDYKTGANIYASVWSEDFLKSLCITASTLVTSVNTSVAASTQAAMEAVTKWMWPRTVWQPSVANFQNIVVVFGGDGNAFVKYSTDQGATFTDHSTGLPAGGKITALVAVGDGAGQVTNYYAIGSDNKIYKETTWTWDAGNALPFGCAKNGISIGYDTNLTAIMANVAAAAAKVEEAPSPYTVWTDKTDAFPATGATSTVIWVTP